MPCFPSCRRRFRRAAGTFFAPQALVFPVPHTYCFALRAPNCCACGAYLMRRRRRYFFVLQAPKFVALQVPIFCVAGADILRRRCPRHRFARAATGEIWRDAIGNNGKKMKKWKTMEKNGKQLKKMEKMEIGPGGISGQECQKGPSPNPLTSAPLRPLPATSLPPSLP